MAKGRSNKRASDSGESPAWLARLGGLMAIAGAVSILGYFVSQSPAAIRKVVSGRSETTLALEQIEISQAPPWLDSELPQAILRTAQIGSRSVDLTDVNLAERIGRAFEANPWIRAAKVLKSHGGLRIELDYRQPVLFVPRQIIRDSGDQKGKGCFVDDTGAVLPASEAQEKQLRGGLAIDNIQVEHVPAVGGRFADQRITAAAILANRLVAEKGRLDLVSIIANTAPGNGISMEVRTRRGSRIVWGVHQHLSDREISRRILLLNNYVSEFGSLEHPNGPYVFDMAAEGPLKPKRIASE